MNFRYPKPSLWLLCQASRQFGRGPPSRIAPPVAAEAEFGARRERR